MRATGLLGLLMFLGAMIVWADDKPAATTTTGATKPPAPKASATYEHVVPPPKAKPAPVAKPLPRVGSWEWLHRVTPRDSDLVAPWVIRRMNNFTFTEPPPGVNDFTSTGR